MPEKITLADGTEKEVPTQEELQELQQKAEKADNVENQLQETKEKLDKLENKDFNFKKLRDMNEEEKNKLTEAERQLKEKQEQLEEQHQQLEQQQQQFNSQIVESYKNEALMALVGENEDAKKEVLENYEKLKTEAGTKEEVYQKMRDAYNMTGKQAPSFNPFSYAHANTGGIPPKKKEESSKVDPEFARKFGLSEEDVNPDAKK